MKAFARMYQRGVAHPGNDWRNYPVEACGTDSVLPLDARESRANMIAAARRYAEHRNATLGKGYIGFRIMRGTSFLNAQPNGGVIFL